jgi:DNA invertase Pin-like site-specific DNA recombinase
MAQTPTTALYIRLSQEDDNIGESNSVKNQRDLLNDFAAKHPELSQTQILEFVDDGHSGTNFNRPAVTKMLEQVRLGKIQNIVVKDFSRFGRNYIEVGGYLEQVFPFLGVRFLSVTDLFDSNDNKGRSAGIEVGFKTLLHDLYSRDLGSKSMAGKVAKTKQGQHVGGTAPFGYVKSKGLKTHGRLTNRQLRPFAVYLRWCWKGRRFLR